MNYLDNNVKKSKELKVKERLGLAVAIGGLASSLMGAVSWREACSVEEKREVYSEKYGKPIPADYYMNVEVRSKYGELAAPFLMGGLFFGMMGGSYALKKHVEQEILKRRDLPQGHR